MAAPTGLTTRARILLPLFLAILLGFSVHRLVCAAGASRIHEFAGPTMGTRYSVKLAAEGLGAQDRGRIARIIEEQLAEVNRLMSSWDPDSELSRFNRHVAPTPFPVSPATLEVFLVAREVSQLSGGAFDVTVGPLVEAWGFGASERAPVAPEEAELTALRARVGFRLVQIDAAGGTLAKRNPATLCDLSAVAKGYAVDRIAEALLARGHADFLVEVGGELRASGRKSDGSRWRVAVETPDPARRSVHHVIELADRALATSGDYRNFYEREGVWISHLIDPRTGHPIEHGLASVSVVDTEAVRADALATALIVMGPEAGYALAAREGLAALFIVRRGGGGLDSRATPGFAALLEAAEQVRAGRGDGG